MSHVFISYARSTAKEAQAVAAALRADGHEVWLDDEIPAHRAYADVIEERLREARAVVVIWSAEAVKSEWVRSEADRARGDHKLVQLSVDGTPLPMPFDQIQCADLPGWTGDLDAPSWRKVVASIAELMRGVAPSNASAAATPPRQHSICVLPFANMSGDPEQEYFSDGISEDIITDLSKVSALAVVSRNSAFRYKGQHVDLPKVARELNVSHVLEGSVRKAGGRVRITAQLIDGATNDHVWAERYDRDLTDIFALQDEISRAIVAALTLKLQPEEKEAIERRGTSSPEAYNLYLMARRYLLTGNAGDSRREEAIIRLTGRAIEIDPDYALAWALLASAQGTLRFRRGRAGDDGLAAAERALTLDPGLADPHAVKALILADSDRTEEGLAEVEVALRLGPESQLAHRTAGMLYSRAGQVRAAISHYAKATDLDETDFTPAGQLASVLWSLGDRDGAREAARKTLARVEAVVARDANNGHAMAFGVGAMAVLGERERAKEWMERALLIDPGNNLMRYNFACALSAFLADTEAALAMLGDVLAECPPGLVRYARDDPDLAPIRNDPRFTAMLAAAEARLAAAARAASA